MTFTLNFMPQETDRIKLERINYSFLDAFHIYSLQDSIYTHLEFSPFKSLTDSKNYLEKLNSRISTGKADYRFLILKESKVLVGLFGFHSYDEERKSIEFGYGVSPKHQRKGLFTEVAQHIIFNLYKNTNIHRIYALTSVNNVASIKGLHKVGFKKEGVLKDYYFKNGEFFDAQISGMVRLK